MDYTIHFVLVKRVGQKSFVSNGDGLFGTAFAVAVYAAILAGLVAKLPFWQPSNLLILDQSFQ